MFLYLLSHFLVSSCWSPSSAQFISTFSIAPFKVTQEVLKAAKDDAIFMNCLPADRNSEQTSEVIDGPQSVVFDQAENRMHAQNAIILFLLGQLPHPL